MKYFNLEHFPLIVRRAIEQDDYSMGRADISVSRLIDAPQIRKLRELHADAIKVDGKRAIAQLLGKAWHAYVERFIQPGELAEERLFATVRGRVLSGGIDLQYEGDHRVSLRDWKLWKVSELKYDHHLAECQLNSYAFLCRANGKVVDDLAVYAVLKDWQEANVERDRQYPTSPVVVIPITLWPEQQARDYVEERMRLHFEEDPVPCCTPQERWLRGEAWALYRSPGSSRASAVFDSAETALAAWKKAPPGAHVQHRAGDPIRCQRNWCEVAQFCPQYLKSLKEKKKNSEAISVKKRNAPGYDDGAIPF